MCVVTKGRIANGRSSRAYLFLNLSSIAVGYSVTFVGWTASQSKAHCQYACHLNELASAGKSSETDRVKVLHPQVHEV